MYSIDVVTAGILFASRMMDKHLGAAENGLAMIQFWFEEKQTANIGVKDEGGAFETVEEEVSLYKKARQEVLKWMEIDYDGGQTFKSFAYPLLPNSQLYDIFMNVGGIKVNALNVAQDMITEKRTKRKDPHVVAHRDSVSQVEIRCITGELVATCYIAVVSPSSESHDKEVARGGAQALCNYLTTTGWGAKPFVV